MNHNLKMFLSSGRLLPRFIKKFNKPDLDKEYLDYINLNDIWANDFKLSLPICGGYADTLYQQSTSTSAGWISQLTGKWGLNNGKTDKDYGNRYD